MHMVRNHTRSDGKNYKGSSLVKVKMSSVHFSEQTGDLA